MSLAFEMAAKDVIKEQRAEIERLTAENEKLRQYLGRAIDIANGSGGDFDWSTEEELRNMRSYQQRLDK